MQCPLGRKLLALNDLGQIQCSDVGDRGRSGSIQESLADSHEYHRIGDLMPSQSTHSSGDIVKLLRHRDYKYVRHLGYGACGETVLLRDDEIDERFVCKKYCPRSGDQEDLFQRFRQEIKILHTLYHPNVVRIYDYFLYPESHAGFIVMEYVEGLAIDKYLIRFPNELEHIFLQMVQGFHYIASQNVLHRDIRNENILVQNGGKLKIIDLGFGKTVHSFSDFDKSISLNWQCVKPLEFKEDKYDFSTEVYFVGKLIERILGEIDDQSFRYGKLISHMSQSDPSKRISSFSDIINEISKSESLERRFDISEDNVEAYRQFSDAISERIASVGRSAKYRTNCQDVQSRLDALFEKTVLETHVSSNLVADCFVEGNYSYYPKKNFPVAIFHDFVRSFRSFEDTRQRVILLNLHTRLDSLRRNDEVSKDNDDIPF